MLSAHLLRAIVCLGAVLVGAVRADERAGSSVLEYDWKDGCRYECKLKLGYSIAGERFRFEGTTAYTPQSADQRDRLDSLLDQAEKGTRKGLSTGTGFLIDPKGTLVTCAHVVRGAKQIKAVLGNRTYAATVVCYDPGRDLALLKVAARGLPHLRVSDSNRVELGQDIRVVGYPLTDMLGNSIKVSQGTISGVIDREGGRRFQIDALVNPGNSGGPLVDSRGDVVGVASELLTADQIDSVGFAIPSEQVLALLKEKGIASDAPSDGSELAGPELARRVTPAVALLKVETADDGVGMRPAKELRYFAVYFSKGQEGYARGTIDDSGKTVVDACGEILSTEGTKSAPTLFQTLGELGIERLPGDGRRQWSYSRSLLLETTESSRPADLYGMRPSLRPPYYRVPSPSSPYRYPGRFGRPSITVATKVVPVREEVSYRRLVESADGAVKIAKNYSLFTLGKDDKGAGGINLKLELEGDLTWDSSIACVKEADLKGSLSLERDDVTIRIPIAMTYGFTRETEQAARERRAKQAKEVAERMKEFEQQRRERQAERERSGGASSGAGRTRTPGMHERPSTEGLKKFNPND